MGTSHLRLGASCTGLPSGLRDVNVRFWGPGHDLQLPQSGLTFRDEGLGLGFRV